MNDLDRPEKDLIDSARLGHESAFELLMRRHSEVIRRLIAHYFRDRSVVDDLAQETFVKAWFALNRFRGDAPFVFWLKQIAVRLCMDELRRRKSRPAPQPHQDGTPEADPVRDEGAATRLEARLLLEKVLAGLNPVDRMILILLYGEGCDTKEVARLAGLSRANVKVRAFRIRRRLRTLYAGGGR